jgi:hypothetical protein
MSARRPNIGSTFLFHRTPSGGWADPLGIPAGRHWCPSGTLRAKWNIHGKNVNIHLDSRFGQRMAAQPVASVKPALGAFELGGYKLEDNGE